MDLLIENAYMILTMDNGKIIRNGAIMVDDNRIIDFGETSYIIRKYGRNFDEVIDVSKMFVSPGFIQTHVHLVQTLFRGLADDLSLLDWLFKKILPFEANIDRNGVYISSMLGCIELLKSGTTTIVDFGSARYENEVFKAIYDSGIRGFSEKILMNYNNGNIPKPLIQNCNEGLSESINLYKKWNNMDNRIKYIFTPRFVLSCTENCLREIAYRAREYNALI